MSSVTLLGLGPADVVGLMLDGRLRYHPAPPTRSRRKGPFPFTIDGASVDLFCAEGRRDLPMAVKSAAADLRWNQQTVLSMLRAGEIRALSGKAMFGATVIPRAEVARAKLEYATTAQVGARLIPEPSMGFLRMLARELRRLGLEPVVGDGGAAGRTGQLIWRAGDVTAADHDALSAWARRFGRTQTKRQRAGSGGRKP